MSFTTDSAGLASSASLATSLRSDVAYAEPSMAGVGDYLALLKPRVMSLVVFTALAGAGASILRLERWARYEGAVLGLALIGLGLLVALHQH